MTEESIKIVLPLPVKVLQPNCTVGSFGGRMMKAAAIKRYRRLTCEAVQGERVESGPWEYMEVEANFFFATRRERDPDNAIGALKAAYDGIVDSGLVPKDDIEHMKRMPPIFDIDKEHPRVELTITRVFPPGI
jgi:hypothetical protein